MENSGLASIGRVTERLLFECLNISLENFIAIFFAISALLMTIIFVYDSLYPQWKPTLTRRHKHVPTDRFYQGMHIVSTLERIKIQREQKKKNVRSLMSQKIAKIRSYDAEVHTWHSDCRICLQKFKKNNEIVELKCHPTHYFHQKCFIQHFKQNQSGSSCPLCRQKFFKRAFDTNNSDWQLAIRSSKNGDQYLFALLKKTEI